MKIKLQIVSDLHLEFRDPSNGYDFLKPCAPILVLAGDICVLGIQVDFKKYEKFIEHFYDKFEHIIHIPGNHEYYSYSGKSAKRRQSMKQIDEKMKEYTKRHPKLHYLNNSIFRLNIKNKLFYFIGTTMWSKMAKNEMEYMQELMNDYVYIWVDNHTFTACDMVATHKKAVGFIKRAIDRAKIDNAAAIVITHHKPYEDLNNKTELSKMYEVDMKKFMQVPVKLWAYGHTHQHADLKYNGVHVVSNALGYPYQRGTGYVPGMCFEVLSM
jgi:predicted phosphodiesterase